MTHPSSKLVVLGLLLSLETALAAPQVDVPSGAQAIPSLSFINYQPSVIRYVDGTNGNDNNSGLQGAPWKSIGKAVRTLQAGEAAVVRYGTYQENIHWSAVNANSGTFDSNTGTCTAPIILRGEPGKTPIVEPLANAPLFHVDRACWIIEGFRLDMMNRPSAIVRFDTAGSHDNILRNSVVSNSGGGAAVSVGGSAHDISLIDNTIHSNFKSSNPTATSCYSHSNCAGTGQVCDVNGYCATRADSHAVHVGPDSYRVLIRGNELYDNSGDGVQCVGPVHSDPPTGTSRPYDITIEDNHIYNTYVTLGASENAVDIKDCDRVTIRRGRFHSFRPTNNATGDKDDGTAIIAHLDAQGIRVEETEIWDACAGIGLGHDRNDLPELLANVTLHHNIIRDGVRGDGTSPRCTGNGILLSRVQNADIYNNTLRNLPGIAFAAGEQVASPTSALNVDLFNNVFSGLFTGGHWLAVKSDYVTDFESSYNLFPSATDPGFRCNFTSGQNLTQWRSCSTGPTHLVTRDPAGQTQVGQPGFTSWGRHFLTATSPGRDVALPIAGARTCGAGQDMGARESGCSAMPTELGWRHQDGTSAAESFLDAAVDGSGNVYAVGRSSGSLAAPYAGGDSDGILRKYSASGAVQWTRPLGRTGTDEARAVAVAPSGDVYVVGVSQGSQAGYNAFIASYDSSGNLRTDGAGAPWLRYLAGTGQTEGFQAVTTDASGHVYAAGFRVSNYVLLPRLAKYASDGTLVWDRNVTNFGSGSLDNVVVDAAGNIYVSFSSEQAMGDIVLKLASTGLGAQNLGFFFEGNIRGLALDGAGNIVVAGETGTDSTVFRHVNRGGTDAFVAKLSPQGALLWSQQPGTSGNDRANAVTVDAAGNILLIGDTSGSLSGQPEAGRQDLFVSKYTSAGVHLWTRQAGTFDGDESAQGGASDGSGGAIVCGSATTAFVGTHAGGTDVICARIASP